MKKFTITLAFFSLFLSLDTLARGGFTETECFHNGDTYKHLIGDKVCPSFEEVHSTPNGNCMIQHEENSTPSKVSSKPCYIAKKTTTVLHCTLTRNVNYNDPDL